MIASIAKILFFLAFLLGKQVEVPDSLWISFRCFPEQINDSAGGATLLTLNYLGNFKACRQSIILPFGDWRLERLQTTHAVPLCFQLLGYHWKLTLEARGKICPNDILSLATKHAQPQWQLDTMEEEEEVLIFLTCSVGKRWLFFPSVPQQTPFVFIHFSLGLNWKA